jgi:hypothetical protein
MDIHGVMGDKFPQERGRSKRGSKGELFMSINPNPLPKIIIGV